MHEQRRKIAKVAVATATFTKTGKVPDQAVPLGCSVDVPWWSNPVTGNEEQPLHEKGFAVAPDKPGPGVEPNPDEVKKHLAPGTGYFEPTENRNNERSWDRLYR